MSQAADRIGALLNDVTEVLTAYERRFGDVPEWMALELKALEALRVIEQVLAIGMPLAAVGRFET